MRRFAPLLMLGLLVSSAVADVTLKDLLGQMADLRWLARPDAQPFTAAQASSYDRKSVKPGNPEWFANGDYGQYIGVEQIEGRTEYVMADLKGPGVVTRIWSANPMGTIRFYVDGQPKARLAEKMSDLLAGKVSPWILPFGYTAAHGFDLYFPFGYAQSLKITVAPKDPQEAAGLYYHVGYRSYAPGVRVENGGADVLRDMGRTALVLLNGLTPMADKKAEMVRVGPGKSYDSGRIEGAGTITGLRFRIPFPLVQTFRAMDWEDANQPHNVLQNLILEVDFDGETTVRAPLGSFFADSPGVNKYSSLPMQVSADGTFTCRWPMPVTHNFRIRLKNAGRVDVPLSVTWDFDSTPPPSDAYRFHAQWNGTRGHTRPIRDMHLLDVHGEGRFVGVSLHVANPTQKWWGEGDEKVTVDDETFPSTFGTGTEDYFGYAWSSNELFDHPYNGQVRSDGPTNFGHSAIHRWQVLDSIPFKKHMQFDLELWHWGDVVASYDWTAYWYAKPGTDGNGPIPMALRLPEKLAPPEPVRGGIEGESLLVSSTGGKTQIQTGFEELSGGAQLWWTNPNPHDKLTIRFPVAKAGRYEIVACFCNAVDYGIHRLSLNGKVLRQIDFFVPVGVEWKKVTLGKFDLPTGDSMLEVECLGKRPAAKPGNMFGLDYLILKPA